MADVGMGTFTANSYCTIRGMSWKRWIMVYDERIEIRKNLLSSILCDPMNKSFMNLSMQLSVNSKGRTRNADPYD